MPAEPSDAQKTGLAQAAGFSLHAGIGIEADARGKLERLCRYVSRPAIAEERLALTQQGDVHLLRATCGGLCMRPKGYDLLMIVSIIDQNDVLTFELERQSPVSTHRYSPMSFPFTDHDREAAGEGGEPARDLPAHRR